MERLCYKAARGGSGLCSVPRLSSAALHRDQARSRASLDAGTSPADTYRRLLDSISSGSYL